MLYSSGLTPNIHHILHKLGKPYTPYELVLTYLIYSPFFLEKTPTRQREKMLATTAMPAPIFNLDFLSHEESQPSLPPFHRDIQQQRQRTRAAAHQPSVPSPLSSSPIRASQTSNYSQSSPTRAMPLAPRDTNALPRQARSSPPRTTDDGSSCGAKFLKFASRTTKPNPLRPANREAAQESRRRQFLDSVRQRRQDRAWERRGGDQEVRCCCFVSFSGIMSLTHSPPAGPETRVGPTDAATSRAERSRCPRYNAGR